MKIIAMCIALLFLSFLVSAANVQNSITVESPTNATLVALPFVPSSGDIHNTTIDSGLAYGFVFLLLGALVFRRFSGNPIKAESDSD